MPAKRDNGRVKRIPLLILLLVISCRRTPAPTDRLLWRLDGPWVSPPSAGGKARVARGTIITFRGGGEYIEHRCGLIERNDEAVYIASRGAETVVTGRWEQRGRELHVMRTKIAGSGTCGAREISFEIDGGSVSGPAGRFSPMTRLVAPGYGDEIDRAKDTSRACT